MNNFGFPGVFANHIAPKQKEDSATLEHLLTDPTHPLSLVK